MPAQTCLPETTPGDQVELKRLAHAVCHPDLEGPAAGLGTREAPVPRRNIVECAVGWYKGCRRLGTRYEKPAVNHLAFWMVAMIEKDLRLLGSSDRGASGSGGHRGQTDLGGIGVRPIYGGHRWGASGSDRFGGHRGLGGIGVRPI